MEENSEGEVEGNLEAEEEENKEAEGEEVMEWGEGVELHGLPPLQLYSGH